VVEKGVRRLIPPDSSLVGYDGSRDVTEEERRVDQEQKARWQPTRTQLLWAGGIAALAFLIIVVCGYLFGWKWTGLPKQTLSDWLQLLIIPAVLAGVGLWFNRQQREQESCRPQIDARKTRRCKHTSIR
jgi:protein-S-isoprenylcysteine O-methyltransferase Ste14